MGPTSVWPRGDRKGGDLWPASPGHAAWCVEESEFIEFSPRHELARLLDHIRKQVQVSSR
jgi:hypothetical protein